MFGVCGKQLNAMERISFRSADPFGFILFTRNCESPDQVKGLIFELKQAVGRDDVPIAIDQEGGRVSRLQPPHWVKYPSARTFGLMYERDPDWGMEAIRLYTRLVAYELAQLGITINCAPVVDLFNSEGSAALGDRAFSSSPETVAALARVQIETFLANGILPVIKHFPGHGGLNADPHNVSATIETPLAVLAGQDFVPFELLKDAPLGMNSHAVFMALDPDAPASLSRVVHEGVIRGKLGFDGLLFSDDLAMKGVKGLPEELALAALRAGNDVILYCNGEIAHAEAIAKELSPMGDASWARWEHAKSMVRPIDPAYNPREDADRLDVLLGGFEFDLPV